MERVAFLVEKTGERVGCLLNPETLVVRRRAGVRPRQSVAGDLTAAGLADDPLLFTGGGTTELELDLLFDVNLAGSTIQSDDVRRLTAPLWELAENAGEGDGGARGHGRPPLVRFVWGKTWNVPAVVAAVAERLEEFTAGGAPQRSWLRMRLLRVAEPPAIPAGSLPPPKGLTDAAGSAGPNPFASPAEPAADEGVVEVHEAVGAFNSDDVGGEGADTPPPPGEHIDTIANAYMGHPAAWKLIAAFNNLTDPLRIAAGTMLRIPPRPGAGPPTPAAGPVLPAPPPAAPEGGAP